MTIYQFPHTTRVWSIEPIPGGFALIPATTQRNSRTGRSGNSVPSGPAFSNQPAIVVACFAGLGIWIVLILLVRWVIALINRMFGG